MRTRYLDDGCIADDSRAGASEWAPGLGRDAMRFVVRTSIDSRNRRVELDLVDGRNDVGVLAQPVEVRGPEVRDTDRPRLARSHQLLERLPRVDVQVTLRQRPVDQDQVDIVEAQPAQRLVEPADCPASALKLAVELGRDEQLFATHAGSLDACTDCGFISVSDGGVEQS